MTGVPPEVTAYLAAVRAALADLPPDERDDLLAEVEASLVEATAESGGNLSARLGPPEEFAAELRAAAGLHEVPSAPRETPLPLLLARRLARDPRLAEFRRLAPIWWVARAYLLVAALALIVGASWSSSYPVIPRLGNGTLGLLALVGAALVSVGLGLKMRTRPIVDLVLLAAAVPVLVHLARPPIRPAIFYVPAAQQYALGLAYNGVPLDNVYPFTRNGRLLHDVLLYTGTGVPLDVGGAAGDPERRVLHTRSGKAVLNAFPIRYYERGTHRVLHPNAAPPITIPRIVTPLLRLPKQRKAH